MSDQSQKTIRIKWVRSGIGFSYHQKRVVRSLGLKKLNQEIEKPDTPQIRGMVAKVPHLVEIVEARTPAAWTRVPEYTIYPPAAAPSKPPEAASAAPGSPPQASLSSRGGESEVGAATGAVEAPADSVAAEASAPTEASSDDSAAAGSEASPEKGQTEA